MSTLFDEVLGFSGGTTRVVIGTGVLGDLGRRIGEVGRFPRALVVTDENVRDALAEPVVSALNAAGVASDLAVVPPGDGSKSLLWAERLYERLGSWRVGRDGVVVAVGGGVITDLAGFVAGTWLRGVDSVLCPTTLEADIDAAIGGKTAVNHACGKNMVGLFHHPRLVVIDTGCLRTLSQRDLVAGAAESIKHAVITGSAFTEWHEAHAGDVLSRRDDVLAALIERNIRVKADFVSRDERDETGVRAVLNFGHTVGHAIEAACGYEYRHGECVSLGMVAACRLSESAGLLPGAVGARIVGLLEAYGLPTCLDRRVDADAVLRLVGRDKKAAAGSVRFVLLEALGRAVLRSDVSESALRDAVASLRSR